MKKRITQFLAASLVVGLTAAPSFAGRDDYDDSQSHPLRVLAYTWHPVGWLAEWTIFRPFHFLVSATRPQQVFFGHNPHPPVLAEPQPLHDYGVAKRVPLQPQKVAPRVPDPVVMPEHVKIVEVPVEKIVVQERVVEVDRMVFTPIAFDFDSAFLSDLGKGQVYLAAQKLKQSGNLNIAIEGHTDSKGSDEYNQKLAAQRAQTVMNELASLGIEPGRMSMVSIGETKPLIDGDARWAHAVNRRVEFQVRPSK